jgi:hypothetical protein
MKIAIEPLTGDPNNRKVIINPFPGLIIETEFTDFNGTDPVEAQVTVHWAGVILTQTQCTINGHSSVVVHPGTTQLLPGGVFGDQ